MSDQEDRLAGKVREIASEALGCAVGASDDTTNFYDLGADELALVELVMDLETEFGIEISDDEADTSKTIADILTFLRRVTGARHVR